MLELVSVDEVLVSEGVEEGHGEEGVVQESFSDSVSLGVHKSDG